jgi:hypothetical protein
MPRGAPAAAALRRASRYWLRSQCAAVVEGNFKDRKNADDTDGDQQHRRMRTNAVVPARKKRADSPYAIAVGRVAAFAMIDGAAGGNDAGSQGRAISLN